MLYKQILFSFICDQLVLRAFIPAFNFYQVSKSEKKTPEKVFVFLQSKLIFFYFIN